MIIDWLSITLCILTAMWLIFTICLLFDEPAGAFCSFCIGLVFLGFCGWGIVAHVYNAKDNQREVNALVLKTDSSIILSVEGRPALTVTDISSYKSLENKTNCTLIQTGYCNIYDQTNWNFDYSLKK